MKQKVALVLSGGGARGLAHIGVIEELEKRGFEIASVSGTSMGAVVGGVYVLGKMEDYKNWMFSLDKLKVFQLIDFTLSMQGFIKGKKVLNKMKEFIPDKLIEEVSIPYTASAVDILKQEEIVFDSGSIYKAIRASIAIPTVLTPMKWDGRLLVDGGVLNNIPIHHVKRTHGDILCVVNVNADVPIINPFGTQLEKEEHESIYQRKIKEFYAHLNLTKSPTSLTKDSIGYFDLIDKTIHIMMHKIGQYELEQNVPDLLVNISKDTCGTFDFFKAQHLVAVGKHAAVKALDDFKAK